MPLRDDVLAPIPGENPSGKNLRYDPIYDKIKEARREDDDAPQGEWQRERKLADWGTVLKLAGEALATKSKDLQLAAWATEALLKKESFAGLHAGIDLLKGLLDSFWDTIYPEIEDGDVELRAAPLEWVGTKLDDGVRKAPLCRAGYGFYRYKESRTIGYEEDAQQSDAKRDARYAAIEDGKLTAEDFDKAFSETGKDFYERAVAELDASREGIEALSAFCEEKFGEYTPSFTKLREAVEEVRHTANSLYQKKREQAGETDQPAAAEVEEETGWAEPERVESGSYAGAAAAPARAPIKKAVIGLEPTGAEDVTARLAAIAKYLRDADGYSPAPYLLLRGYRWGEIRAAGSTPDAALLEAPPTEVRQQLKRAMLDSDWAKVLELAETVMAQPCGRGWLDLQRYVVTAAEQYGYPQIAAAVISGVRALINDMPELRRVTLLDDTPTGNPETQQWLDQILGGSGTESRSGKARQTPSMVDEEPEPVAEDAAPDSYELALAAVRAGRADEGIEILAIEASRQSSGRARFQRRLQLAELCVKAGEHNVAQPILEELVGEIDEHKLDGWEASDVVAYPLRMLLGCLAKLDGDAAMRQKLYSRICRLDPVQALRSKP